MFLLLLLLNFILKPSDSQNIPKNSTKNSTYKKIVQSTNMGVSFTQLPQMWMFYITTVIMIKTRELTINTNLIKQSRTSLKQTFCQLYPTDVPFLVQGSHLACGYLFPPIWDSLSLMTLILDEYWPNYFVECPSMWVSLMLPHN